MSDQGYPGSPDYGQEQPAFGENQQPPEYGQPGEPQQPPPEYSPPPPYSPPPAAGPQPDYGQQTGYGPPPTYADPQYPTGQYPTQQFPAAQYPPGATPPPYQPYQQPAQPGGGGGRRGIVLAAIVALLVAAGVGAYFVFSGSSADAGTPKRAVSDLLDAGKTGDVAAAKKALCKSAANSGVVTALRSAGRITTYTVRSVRTIDSTHAIVIARLATTQISTPIDATFPVVKEDGSWKACPDLSSISGSGSGGVPSNLPSGIPSSLPSGIPSVPVSIPSVGSLPSGLPSFSLPAGLPSSIANLNPCSLSGGSVEQSATTYVGLAEVGEVSYAQACVYHDAVPKAVTQSLRATTSAGYYAPTGTHGNTVEFVSIDGKSHVEVTMTKESDGSYYVTKVEKG